MHTLPTTISSLAGATEEGTGELSSTVAQISHATLSPLLGTYLAIVKAWTWTAETLQPVPHVPAPNPKPSTGVHASHTNQTGACVLCVYAETVIFCLV